MEQSHKDFIVKNRFSKSMLDMASELQISYTAVRNFMVKNNLTITKKQVLEIRSKKVISQNKTHKSSNPMDRYRFY